MQETTKRTNITFDSIKTECHKNVEFTSKEFNKIKSTNLNCKW